MEGPPAFVAPLPPDESRQNTTMFSATSFEKSYNERTPEFYQCRQSLIERGPAVLVSNDARLVAGRLLSAAVGRSSHEAQ